MAESTHVIADKHLVMLIGPTAVGKSTVMNAVVAQDNEFKRVLGFTTRPPRSNDEPGQYRYMSHQTVEELIAAGQVLQHVVNPANGHVYGTTGADYPGRYNVKDTLSRAVADFRQLPFESTRVISLTVPAGPWHQWLDMRYPEPSTERTMRLREAKESIEWSLQQTASHTWLINQPGRENDVAKSLIDMVRGGESQYSVPQEAQKLLRLVNDLLSYN